MRDLTRHGVATARRDLPKGLAFEIADLVLIRSWAEFQGVHMEIRLDHGTLAEEYEEVIALHASPRAIWRMLLWRNADAVFVQPLVGRRKRYASVSAALESLLPKSRVAVTDIAATGWPPH
ncbi:MAG: hypothetical protein P4L71_18300 [Acetobacteraceae bacterium]|nr:hypothetical protein [Acetobacteraceae bacterium]